MNKITKLNFKTTAVATMATLLLVCLASYSAAPQSANLFEAINPVTALAGIVFTLAFVGTPLALSFIITALIVATVWFLFLMVARSIFK